jgi:hypothetical protein
MMDGPPTNRVVADALTKTRVVAGTIPKSRNGSRTSRLFIADATTQQNNRLSRRDNRLKPEKSGVTPYKVEVNK